MKEFISCWPGTSCRGFVYSVLLFLIDFFLHLPTIGELLFHGYIMPDAEIHETVLNETGMRHSFRNSFSIVSCCGFENRSGNPCERHSWTLLRTLNPTVAKESTGAPYKIRIRKAPEEDEYKLIKENSFWIHPGMDLDSFFHLRAGFSNNNRNENQNVENPAVCNG